MKASICRLQDFSSLWLIKILLRMKTHLRVFEKIDDIFNAPRMGMMFIQIAFHDNHRAMIVNPMQGSKLCAKKWLILTSKIY